MIAASLLLPLLIAGCVEHQIAKGRVKAALVDAGLPRATSQCMARRMVAQLTTAQLRKLKAFQGPKRTVDDYLAAADRVNDPQAIRVTITAAGFCGNAYASDPME